jgi:hypothetical protein
MIHSGGLRAGRQPAPDESGAGRRERAMAAMNPAWIAVIRWTVSRREKTLRHL